MLPEIETIVRTYHETRDFSGVCLVTRSGEIVFQKAYGFAHRGFGVPNRTTTRFDTASITKLFTATAVMQMVDRRLVALDSRVMPFLGITGTAISDEVTVFHLLTHTSGIADDADEEAGEDYELLFVDKPNYAIRATRDFLPQFAYKRPNFPPGTGVRYNNCAFVLLGLVIERVTGMTYRDYIREHVFAPAGMAGADFCAMDGVNADLAEGYKAVMQEDGTRIWKKNIYSYPPVGSPDGGATVTAMDLHFFLRALREERLTSVESAHNLLSPHVEIETQAGTRRMYGFGFEFFLDETGQVTAIQKDGINAGAGGMLRFFPQSDTTLVVLANQECDIWSMCDELSPTLQTAQ